jgi:hypothetical protein
MNADERRKRKIVEEGIACFPFGLRYLRLSAAKLL